MSSTTPFAAKRISGERPTSTRVFVSYSRQDAALVSPIVALLRSALAGFAPQPRERWELVFQDIDGILPGADWRAEVESAIARSGQVFAFWCSHSSTSREVKLELETARALEKKIIPILIDASPLSPELERIHAVDLRPLGLHAREDQLRGGSATEETLIVRFAPVFHIDPATLLRGLKR